MNSIKSRPYAQTSVKYDVYLRAYVLQIFNLMTVALFITGLTAYLAGNSEEFLKLIYLSSATEIKLSPIGWIIQLAPLFMVFFLSYQINKVSIEIAQIIFWIYSALMGLSLASIFLLYTGESIARTFFITASVFGMMSIYGYTTQKDFTSFGSFLIMGVIGIVIASLVNLFMLSSALSFAISIIGVIVFTGLTAYDVQTLKNIYKNLTGRYKVDRETAGKIAIHGALRLYLDFINLFLMLIHFTGSKKEH